MAAVLCSKYPQKAPELFAYQAAIVRAARNIEGVSYDRQYRREALARKDLNWSVPNVRLYNEAFMGCARPNQKCIYCVNDDHPSAQCLLNPNRSWVQWLQEVPSVPHPGPTPPVTATTTSRALPSEICRRYNRGSCNNHLKCKYRHACLDYGQTDHRISDCRHYTAKGSYGAGRA